MKTESGREETFPEGLYTSFQPSIIENIYLGHCTVKVQNQSLPALQKSENFAEVNYFLCQILKN